MALPSREFVISEVDREFLLQHPEAPRKLDPDDPSQAHLVQQWQQMFNEFVNRTVDSHFYRFFPNSPRLEAGNPEHAQLIEYWLDMRDAIRDNKPPRYNWDEHQLAADAASASAPAAGGAHQDAGADAGAQPTVGAQMDESAFKEYVHQALEGAHYVGDSAEVLGYLAQAGGAGEESAAVLLGEALGPIGMIASTIIVLWATAHAFGTGRRLQEQEGFCYGVMWETAGLGNAQKGFIDWFDDSADELREAFYDGVTSGREKAADTVVHNKVILAVAYYQASGQDLEQARSSVLNDLWQHVRETDLGRDYLSWPQPMSMGD